MINTLIVDDDYRVSTIHAAYVEKIDGFRVAGRAHTAADCAHSVAQTHPDLVLLDLYLPDEHGLVLLRRLRETRPPHPDVIVITAARDIASLRTAMQLGVVHYLVKPFTFARLNERLTTYRRLRDRIAALDAADQATDQEQVDTLYGLLRTPASSPAPKGQSAVTTNRVLRVLHGADHDLSAADIADAVGVSRPTAHRYLARLVKTGAVRLDLRYGSTGRPEHRYRPL